MYITFSLFFNDIGMMQLFYPLIMNSKYNRTMPCAMERINKMKNESGTTLLETIVALALLGIIASSILGALSTSSSARSVADAHAAARILAKSQMEYLREQTYAFSYDTAPIPSDYPGYTAVLNVDNIRNGNLQKLDVTIRYHNQDVETLESYKVNR